MIGKSALIALLSLSASLGAMQGARAQLGNSQTTYAVPPGYGPGYVNPGYASPYYNPYRRWDYPPSPYGYARGYGTGYYPAPGNISIYEGGGQVAQPAEAREPISQMFEEMQNRLAKASDEGRISTSDLTHLSMRLKDVMRKEASLRSNDGGALSDASEAEVRKDISQLRAEMVYRIKL